MRAAGWCCRMRRASAWRSPPLGAGVSCRTQSWQPLEGERVDIILPAAGFGTRLRPHTWSKPKPLVTVAGKPMIEHILDQLMPYGPSKLVFITGYLGDQLEAWARKRYTD